MRQDYHSLAYSTSTEAKWEGVLDLKPLHSPFAWNETPSKKVRKTLLTQIATGSLTHWFQLRYCLVAGKLKLFLQLFQ